MVAIMFEILVRLLLDLVVLISGYKFMSSENLSSNSPSLFILEITSFGGKISLTGSFWYPLTSIEFSLS
jgi:hypothetical protein